MKCAHNYSPQLWLDATYKTEKRFYIFSPIIQQNVSNVSKIANFSFRGDFRKKTRWFEDICQISTDPPSPHLILDIFILDKYKLVFTPPPPT